MYNHLSYRWPAGEPRSGLHAPPPPRPPRRSRKFPRVLLVVCAVVLALALLVGAGFWGMRFLADSLTESPRPIPSTPSSTSAQDEWTPADLPWTDPTSTVQLSLDGASQDVHTAGEIYQSVLPSVVSVTATHADGASSVGSGVVVTQSGYIVTNYHIIEGGTQLSISLLPDERVYDAAVVGYDEELDLAVLKADAQGLTPARLGNSDGLAVGDRVYAIGNPMGYLHGTMTEGIISSLVRSITVDGKSMNLLQTSAALNSGNSGGALVNDRGQVVGITTAKITGIQNDTVIEGLGLVIPITDALPFLNRILATGESWRPSLGILCTEAQMDNYRGVLVKELTPDTPAAQLLWEGDLIISANGADTPTLYALTRILNDTGVGGTVELTLLREGLLTTVSITLYDRLTQ